eukprot:GHVR01016087.1.p4 GENE.GHVR01016087.1~~GHVR01016087.1.p4  ORF type:complete len:140 (-),score=16.50 GHVR01016087.1:497-916(-)
MQECTPDNLNTNTHLHKHPLYPHCSNLKHIHPLPHIQITSSHVTQAARALQGGHGPGGTDSSHWTDALFRHGPQSDRLRDAVAALTSNENVSWHHFQALLANRLIALNKYQGVRPIAIGEALRRLMAKVMLVATKTKLP